MNGDEKADFAIAVNDLTHTTLWDVTDFFLLSRAATMQKATTAMKKSGAKQGKGEASPSQLIDARIAVLKDWRGETLARVRALIREADPEIVEAVKWRKPSNAMLGVPVWEHDGIVCTGETYKSIVKLTFSHGAALEDSSGLFNASLEGGTRRAIDIGEGERINAKALKALIREAIALNMSRRKAGAKAKPSAGRPIKTRTGEKLAKTALLSGGNPQIAMADGDAPVQTYIAAMPGWKRDVGKRLDALIVRNVPNLRKAVKWNSPFYGIEGQGWFLSFHVLTRYVKVAFFRGAQLKPLPPGVSKGKDTRYIDIHEGDGLDEALVARWVKQAAALPGFLDPRR